MHTPLTANFAKHMLDEHTLTSQTAVEYQKPLLSERRWLFANLVHRERSADPWIAEKRAVAEHFQLRE